MIFVALEEVFSETVILHQCIVGRHTLFTPYILMSPLGTLCFVSDYIQFNSSWGFLLLKTGDEKVL